MVIAEVTPRGEAIEVLDPVGPVRAVRYMQASRLQSLQGARVGFLENSKPNADALLGGVYDFLAEQFSATLVRHYIKSGPASPAPAEWYSVLQEECDLVLTGSGDCGSCTSWTVYDSIELEKLGVPVVLMATDEFLFLAESERETLGLPELAIVTVPYPVGGIDPTETRAKAYAVAPLAVDALLERSD